MRHRQATAPSTAAPTVRNTATGEPLEPPAPAGADEGCPSSSALAVTSSRHQQNSRRGRTPFGYAAASAYFATSPPARPGCPSSSRPTTSHCCTGRAEEIQPIQLYYPMFPGEESKYILVPSRNLYH